MKFNVSRAELSNKLASVSRAVASRSTLPILGNVLVLASVDGVFLKATNLEFGVVAKLNGANVDESGSTTVPAKKFSDVVGVISGDNVEFTSDERSLTLKCGKQRNKLSTLPADDFPVIDTGGNVLATFSGELFSRMVKSVQDCFSQEQSRPALTGVHIVSSGSMLKFEAADGFRLGQNETEYNLGVFDVLVPGKNLVDSVKFVGESVELRKEQNSLVFDFGDVIAVLQEIDAHFPDTSSIVPKISDDSFIVSLGKAEFSSALRAADVFARESAHTIRMSLVGDNIVLRGVSAESGENESEVEVVELKNAIDSFEIAYNALYMKNAVDSLQGEAANVLMSSKTSPLLVFGGDQGHKHVIMPLNLSK